MYLITCWCCLPFPSMRMLGNITNKYRCFVYSLRSKHNRKIAEDVCQLNCSILEQKSVVMNQKIKLLQLELKKAIREVESLVSDKSTGMS